MALKIVMILNLLGYTFIASQAFFYLLAMSNAQRNLNAPAYIELRNLLDSNLMIKLRPAYYSVLVSSPLLCILSIGRPGSLVFITSVIACIALWIDVYMMFKGNLPINKQIRSWTPDKYPANWQSYRAAWLSYYHKRQAASIIGFISLVAGCVFG